MSLFGSSSGKQLLIPPISPPSFLRIDRQIYTTSPIHPSIHHFQYSQVRTNKPIYLGPTEPAPAVNPPTQSQTAAPADKPKVRLTPPHNHTTTITQLRNITNDTYSPAASARPKRPPATTACSSPRRRTRRRSASLPLTSIRAVWLGLGSRFSRLDCLLLAWFL